MEKASALSRRLYASRRNVAARAMERLRDSCDAFLPVRDSTDLQNKRTSYRLNGPTVLASFNDVIICSPDCF